MATHCLVVTPRLTFLFSTNLLTRLFPISTATAQKPGESGTHGTRHALTPSEPLSACLACVTFHPTRMGDRRMHPASLVAGFALERAVVRVPGHGTGHGSPALPSVSIQTMETQYMAKPVQRNAVNKTQTQLHKNKKTRGRQRVREMPSFRRETSSCFLSCAHDTTRRRVLGKPDGHRHCHSIATPIQGVNQQTGAATARRAPGQRERYPPPAPVARSACNRACREKKRA